TLLYVLYIIFILLTNFKNIKTRKYIPIIIYFVFGTLAAILQMINPQLLITSSIETFITILMYHTIENPDVTILRQLNMEKNRADKANNAKTEFLSSMSHEIRTPLNAIDGFSQLILEENDINVIKEEARDIMSASQNLLEIVNGILDISKIEANKLEIVNVEYEPTKIFEDVSKLAKTRIGNKPVKLITNIAQDLPDYLNGDYGRIKQITLNLLTNAVKYTKEGYVDYSVKCVRKDNVCRLIIIVKDTGIGIKKENIDKLFNKFERFDSQNNITIEGTGLGLAITKKLVDLMNGKIVVDSVYGKGSLFGVSIDQIISPRTKDQKSVENTTTDTLISYSNRKVLIVDDNKVNLKVASKLLETFGVSSDCVSSGDECISKINDGFIYDLILMDDMMPGKSGTETFKLLKQNPDFHIPVVVLTANAIEGMRENYIKEGFNDYISKPIDKKELERVLNIYLN
nr:response regulator [Bacilli bacterium]